MTGAEIAMLASAAISTGSGVANAISAGKMNKRGVKYATEENARMRDFQREMFNAQNAYNDPTALMARLKKAGINPHYYIGQGAVNNQSASVPSSSGGLVPNLRPVDFTPMGQGVQTMLNAEMIKAQINNINADTKKKNEETTGQVLANGITTQNLANMPTSIDLDNQVKRANIGNTTEQTELAKARVASEKQELLNKISTNDKIKQEIDNLISTKELTEQQTNNLIVSMAFTQAQIKTEGIKQVNIKSDTELKKSQAYYNKELGKTQSFIRSNLTANTAYQNAGTKNLGAVYGNLTEEFKKLQRSNYIGEQYDLNKARNDFQEQSDRINVIRQTYRNLMKDEQFKDLKITEQEFINANMGVDMMLSPVTKQLELRGGTTTTRFDSRGDYSGHTTTRRHR